MNFILRLALDLLQLFYNMTAMFMPGNKKTRQRGRSMEGIVSTAATASTLEQRVVDMFQGKGGFAPVFSDGDLASRVDIIRQMIE
jgi:hypothetical protein